MYNIALCDDEQDFADEMSGIRKKAVRRSV